MKNKIYLIGFGILVGSLNYSCSVFKKNTKKEPEVIQVISKEKPEEKVLTEKEKQKLLKKYIKDERYTTSPTWQGCNDGDEQCFRMNLVRHIQKNFFYPTEARENGYQGKSFVSFSYGIDGKVESESVKVVRGSGYAILDEAAVRLIKTLPKLKAPGYKDKKPVSVKYTIPVRYALN